MNAFDELTKKLSDGISRRDAVKVMAASVLGTMLAPLAGGSAFAASDAPDANVCKGIPGSSCGVSPCPNRTCSGLGCYCFPKGMNVNRTKCGTNQYCYNSQLCPAGTVCPLGFFCSITCCGSTPLCIKACRAHTPCVPGIQPGGGLTAAG